MTSAERLARLFNDGVMGFLALIALGITIGPMVFHLSPGVERVLDVVGWLLVAAFTAEFIIQGVVAPDRRAWLRSPWRIVDALTVLGPIVAPLPQVTDEARGLLVLRMVRVVRAAAMGTRAAVSAAQRPRDAGHVVRDPTPRVTIVSAAGDAPPVASDWNSVLAWSRQPAASWFHVSNLDPDRFRELARAAGVSDPEIDDIIQKDGPAKLSEGGDFATLILQMPTMEDGPLPVVHRHRILAIVTKPGILTATTSGFDLQARVQLLSPRTAPRPLAFPTRIVCAVLGLAGECNRTLVHRFDEEARRLELLEGGQAFLRDTFRLRREISATALDLWHVKGIVETLAGGKATLAGVSLAGNQYLDNLRVETQSLYQMVSASKDEVSALIDLNINVKSFEMNAFLKLLAIVSFLGLIPATVAGLLGMNVIGSPWPLTLGQVSFGVTMGMATVLYLFGVKGWLK